MNYILLSGGSGKRLWPLSNDVRSKQFIKVFRDDAGNYLSMVQNIYKQINDIDTNAKITIATSETQVPMIYNQLGNEVSLCVEPCRRDTFPAIVLATAYLRDVLHVSEDETVVVCPVDPFVDLNYFAAMQQLDELTQNGVANLTLMGIEPTYPSEKYGYIMPKNKDIVSSVDSFKEKPDSKTAEKYIKDGALWNAGVFAYKLKYVLNKAEKLLNFVSFEDLLARYESLEKISFDYAVVENEQDIQVLRFNGEWKDLGTWNAFAEVVEESVIGKGILDSECNNTKIINELDIPILCMGLQDVIVAASDQGILVSDKASSDYIKPYVEKIDDTIMFAEKMWGTYRVISKSDNSLVAQLKIKKNGEISYHYHETRDEIWNVISGEGKVIINGKECIVEAGSCIRIPKKTKHSICANTEMEIIEVQISGTKGASDIIECCE